MGGGKVLEAEVDDVDDDDDSHDTETEVAVLDVLDVCDVLYWAPIILLRSDYLYGYQYGLIFM
jgi:hypothetical protein